MSRPSGKKNYLTDEEFRAWSGCLRLTTGVMRALDESLTAEHQISVKEFDVLITLFNAPGGRLRMTELAERVVLSPAGVTHLISRLERGGLVGRTVDPEDRRGFFAILTPAGQKRLRKARPTHNDVIRTHLTRRLSAGQLAALGDLLEAISEPRSNDV